jgi:putative ABC transport system permease protein
MNGKYTRISSFLNLTKESLIFAFHAVIINKLRTLLSLLGITIGIFAIISVFTVIDSLQNNIRSSISSLGSDIIYIQKWPWTFGPDFAWWEYMKRPVPRLQEFEEIKRRSQTAAAVCFSASTSRTVKYKNNSVDNIGVWVNTYEFPEIRAFELAEGRYFTQIEAQAGRNIAVIGYDLAKTLFRKENPLGKQIIISGRKVTIVGISAKEGKDLIGGGSLDNMVLLPLNYARSIFDVKDESMNPFIMVKSKANVALPEMVDELRGIMRTYKRLKPKQEDNFSLNQASMISKGIESIFSIMNFAGWFIGGFSILVGGFGIANIMFVSVKERTNMIGIQKALGAKNYYILLQFLFESILLALSGGIIGLLMVFAGTLIVSAISDFHIYLTIGNIGMGLFISALIGIISGYIPAFSASRLDPVKAISTTF